ncbi:hypothetical protein GYMLUDRAFT_560052 [Collybiopsis luxurians FD-317 M1]|uniref:Uncharacterized protein n=1 Tax=Collybiopsis luxurians FD-317 M1 TaxID=944289 RepID=A0A0D0CZH5_9AGAR|nr:hypothetical protein GYMLUDRAFT_560052 [Collybiopsis luxurians FD-317 M1]
MKRCFAFLRSSPKPIYNLICPPYTVSWRRTSVRIRIMDQKGNDSWRRYKKAVADFVDSFYYSYRIEDIPDGERVERATATQFVGTSLRLHVCSRILFITRTYYSSFLPRTNGTQLRSMASLSTCPLPCPHCILPNPKYLSIQTRTSRGGSNTK